VIARRLAAFAALLAAVAAAAAAVGAATRGPGTAAPEPAMAGMEAAAHTDGLAATADGLTFEPQRTRFAPGSDFRFRIVGSDGRPRSDFDLEGGVRLHLLLVRRDLTGYAHLHPALRPDGSWSVPLAFARPGVYRAFADFEQDGEKSVLGLDLFVAGSSAAEPLPAPSTVAHVDGFRVSLAAPELRAGEESELAFAVTRNGEPVRSFERYVGMRGHLVALHEGDLAYAHVHPRDTTAGGRIDFDAELAAPGSYRLFLQFKVGGRVHTAPFTVEVAR
jgi:hypothetical protein